MSRLALMPDSGTSSAAMADAHRFRVDRFPVADHLVLTTRAVPDAEEPRLTETLKAREMERKRIAADLHDSIGQSLSALRFGIAAALACVHEGKSEVAGNILETLSKQVQETIIEVQRIAMDLRPAMLDDIGLVGTLSWFCREFRSIHTDLALTTDIRIAERDVAPELRAIIFRLLQEALSNVVKHAGATEVHLRLRRAKREVQLIISDNGIGFVPEQRHRGTATAAGMGLKGMRDRAELSGGRFRLVSVPNLGTRIHVAWPLHPH